MTPVATRVSCPVEGCTYAADNGASIPAHVSMAHPEVPMDVIAPKRSAPVDSFVETRIGAEQDVVKPKRSARNAVEDRCLRDGHLCRTHGVEWVANDERCSARGGRSSGQTVTPAGAARLEDIPLDLVEVGTNVRVDVAALEELTASIAEHGVLQPVKVTPMADGRYRLVWGQRRTVAARHAGLERIPAIIETRDLAGGVDLAEDGATRSIEQLVENLHREDLPALDRARAIRDVVASGMSQADLARKLGIAPSTVANDLGLLEAPAVVLRYVEEGKLSPAHAKAMKGLAPKTQVELAGDVIANGFSAHRTEVEVQRRKERADREREQEAAQAKAREAKRASAEASIAEFEKKKVAKDDLIVVDTGYSGSVGHVVKWIESAGYTNVRAAKSWQEIQARPAGDACDCTAWKAAEHSSYSYTSGASVEKYRISITKGCIDSKHQVAKERATEQKRREKEALATRVQQHVRSTAAGWSIHGGRAIAIDRILAEAALWGLLSYRIPTWAEAHGGKKTNPFAAIHALSDGELAKELAQEIASDFRDKAGYHVDWAALAAELMPEAGDGGA